MKLLGLVSAAFFINPMQVKEYKNVRHEITKTDEIRMNPNADIFNIDLYKKDLKKENDKWIFSANTPTKLLLSKEDSKAIHDVNNEVKEIKLNYSIDILANKKKLFIEDTHLFDWNMDLKSTKWDKKNIVETGSKENEITFGNKDGKAGLQVKPFLKLNINDFENDINRDKLGHYHMKLNEIIIKFDYKYFGLANIKSKPLFIKLDHSYYDEKKLIKSKLSEWINDEYHLAEAIDVDQTFKNLKTDELNHLKTNRFFVKLEPRANKNIRGTIVQEIIIEYDKRSILDLYAEETIYSSKLHKLFYEHYIDPKNLNIVINLDQNKISINRDNDTIVRDFVNDGSLNNFREYKEVKIIKDKLICGQWINDELKIRDYEKIKHLFGDINVENNEQTNVKEEKPIDTEFIEPEKNSQEIKADGKQKSSPLKYLWLLAIPFCLGIFCLITWLMPLLKRKK